jgi:lysyl-tRNA synthetase class II
MTVRNFQKVSSILHRSHSELIKWVSVLCRFTLTLSPQTVVHWRSSADLGLNPFPSKSRRTHYAGALTSEFATYEGQTATVAGRLMSRRKQGGLAFGHVQDRTGGIQLFLKKQSVQGLNKETGTIGFPEFNLLDLSDIVEATGKIMKTEQGESLSWLIQGKVFYSAARQRNQAC